MIQGYADHAANERTFLAWVRTGVAVIAFGFVIEKQRRAWLMLIRISITPAAYDAICSTLPQRARLRGRCSAREAV